MVLSHQTGVRIPVALPTDLPARPSVARGSRLLRTAARALLTAGLLAAPLPRAEAQPREASRPSIAGLPANVERLDSLGGITKYRLRSNGMTIYVVPNHAAPVITFEVVYHVGSRNEAPGNTGSAHLLEHMLFNKSTRDFGKANGKKTFQEVLYEAGADYGSSNMTTWNDRMTGYSTLPAEKLELAMKIEADRLGRALILDSERQPEMSVVRNEYEIGENNPYNVVDKAVIGETIQAHPYHWDTIGYRSDIEGVSTEKLREHYEDFFHPDNAEAILVGDFDVAAALGIFDREFGGFPRAKRPIPAVITVEPPQEGERRAVVKRPGTVGIVELAYLRPGALDPDYVPLDVLTTILTAGVNSRLRQELVEKGIATDVSAWNFQFRDPYPIAVNATVAPGKSHEEVEAALKSALYRIGREGVSPAELTRAKQQLEVSVIRGRDGTYELASSLGEAVASANWKWFVGYVDSVRQVTAEDVRRVAAKYLVPDHANVGWFVPLSDEPPKAAKKEPAPKAKKHGAGGASDGTAAEGFASRTLHRVLPNGITLDVLANHAVPTVAIRGTVFAGRMHAPPAEPAVPGLTAEMLNRGTTTRDKRAIGAMLDGVGAQLSIAGGLTEGTVTGSGLSRDLRLLLSTLADELRHPSFPDSELAKAKVETKADILRGDDNTRQRAWDRLTRLVFPEGHPYRAPTTETLLASLDRATVADLRAYYTKRWVGSSLILAVVGDVDPVATAALVDSLFGPMPRGERPAPGVATTAPDAPQRAVERMPGKANIDFVYGEASGLKRLDPDYEASIIANAALGQSSLTSRIGKRVRDTEGLSYTLYSRFLWSDWVDGVWLVDVAVAPQNLAKALRSTKEEIDRYCRDGITDPEVAVQKEFFAGNFLVNLGTNAGIAAALATAEKFGFGPAYLDDFPKRIRAVTKDQVNQAIRKRLDPAKMHVVVAGDVASIPE